MLAVGELERVPALTVTSPVRCFLIIYLKGAVATGRVPSQKIAQLSLNKSQEDIFYTNT